MQLQKGALLLGEKYKIEKVLGQGGFGITYLAKKQEVIKGNLGEVDSFMHVAIKEFFMKDFCNREGDSSAISTPMAGSQDLVRRFRSKFKKEAENTSKLRHKNIVKVIEVFEENDTVYYVMEFVDGDSLDGYIDKNGALSEATALNFTRQLSDALAYIHDKKINHLDVKPANILVRSDNTIVLIDFGLAKCYDQSGGPTTSTAPAAISAGYAPLEQYQTGGVTHFAASTDIYALGATLFKMVTGTTPPEASYVNNEGLPEITGVSDKLVSAINSAMESRYKERPQSVAEFVAMLPEGGGESDGDVTTIINSGSSSVVGVSSNRSSNYSGVSDTDSSPVVDSTSKPTTKSPKKSSKQKKKAKLNSGVMIAAVFAGMLVLSAGYMLATNLQEKAELKAEQARIEVLERLEAQRRAEEQAIIEARLQAEEEARVSDAARKREAEARKREAERLRQLEEERLRQQQQQQQEQQQQEQQQQQQQPQQGEPSNIGATTTDVSEDDTPPKPDGDGYVPAQNEGGGRPGHSTGFGQNPRQNPRQNPQPKGTGKDIDKQTPSNQKGQQGGNNNNNQDRSR